ncbi:6-bladed beta-propeller [Sulfidibacter corallicola]|uniref:6-bladed beta-propeller n=1 Tax=Sulfidibacter corallicola TaxID=2818388 RepID=A0A8A4TKZ3_SULCO|nr:6-bladed beta-propeller [Sulfidibacter corallicola]QTD49792.1 6-bladed beta-propeller [Sulfidibacter corallicola]
MMPRFYKGQVAMLLLCAILAGVIGMGHAMAGGPKLIQTGSLGGEDDDWSFTGGTQMAVDSAGDLYVLDPGNYRVLRFDSDWRLKKEFGRQGNGPGEFEEPKSIQITPEGHIAVFDSTLKRLTLFDGEGKVLKTKRLESSIVAVYRSVVLDGGKAAFISAKSSQGKPIYDLSIYDADMAEQISLVRLKVDPLDWSKANETAFWVDFLRERMELFAGGIPVLGSLNERVLVYGRANQYQLTFADGEGNSVRHISRDLKPKPFTEEMKRAAFEGIWVQLCADPFLATRLTQSVFESAIRKADIPPALPMIHAIVRLESGIGVLANYHPVDHTGVFDLFDAQGRHLASCDWKGSVLQMIGAGRRVYTVGFDADDNMVIRRYRFDDAGFPTR